MNPARAARDRPGRSADWGDAATAATGSIEDARDWLRRAGYAHDPQVSTALDQQFNDAIHRGVEWAQQPGHGHGQGDYVWEDHSRTATSPRASPYQEESAELARFSPDGLSAEAVQAAATAIADAGQVLASRWQAAINAGNYEYYSLTYDQHQFIQHCTQARAALHQS